MKLATNVIRRELTLFHADTQIIDEAKSRLFNCWTRLPYNAQSYALYTHEPTKKVTTVGALFSARRRPFFCLAIPVYETHCWTVTAERLTRRRNLAFIHKVGHHTLATRKEIRCVLCDLRPDS
jgi:hypothetical protein